LQKKRVRELRFEPLPSFSAKAAQRRVRRAGEVHVQCPFEGCHVVRGRSRRRRSFETVLRRIGGVVDHDGIQFSGIDASQASGPSAASSRRCWRAWSILRRRSGGVGNKLKAVDDTLRSTCVERLGPKLSRSCLEAV